MLFLECFRHANYTEVHAAENNVSAASLNRKQTINLHEMLKTHTYIYYDIYIYIYIVNWSRYRLYVRIYVNIYIIMRRHSYKLRNKTCYASQKKNMYIK